MRFEWDAGNQAKCQKHGVSIAEVEQVIQTGIIAPDIVHSSAEDRFMARGRAHSGRSVFAVFTVRNGKARPISARYRHRKEIDRHGKT